MALGDLCGPCGNYLCAMHGCQRGALCRPATTYTPSVQEQMGEDPTSRLARAIERLCELLEQKEA